jgi:hypothetical protein
MRKLPTRPPPKALEDGKIPVPATEYPRERTGWAASSAQAEKEILVKISHG